MSRRYLVQNISKEMQHFEGHALGAVRGGREGGSIWLPESTYLASAQPRVEQGVLALIKVNPPFPSPKEPEQPKEVLEQTDTVVEPEEVVEEQSEDVKEAVDYSSMKTSELRALLKERGLYDSSVRKKTLMIELLEADDEN